jgi:uncharacterized protein (TIGR02145 family)
MRKKSFISLFTLVLYTIILLSCSDENGTNNDFVIVYGDGVTDIAGNTYQTVIIGNQEWMVGNLKTTSYNDGTPISLVEPTDDWNGLDEEAYCWYENDISAALDKSYGALYNHFAVASGKLPPDGWHVPTAAEWDELDAFISNNGHGLKAATGWNGDGNGDNKYGFFAFPAGYRSNNGVFHEAGNNGYWWSASEISKVSAAGRILSSGSNQLTVYMSNKSTGFSVRCVKD